jgi:2Fe-2S ferredoxin
VTAQCTVVVNLPGGGSLTIEPELPSTLMEAIRQAGVEDLAAICGGCLSCATCHVHVARECLPLLPAMSAEENELLSYSDKRSDNSRLSCQIPLSVELNRLQVTVVAEG